ncbi:MAG: helix-turn-helix domain-containing protein [Bacteroidota bacterium]
MKNPNPSENLRSRYLRFMVYRCITRSALCADEQEEITNYYYQFREQLHQHENNRYTGTALDIFREGQRLNVSPQQVFEQMERWRKRCLNELRDTGSLEEWAAAPDELTGETDWAKVKLIRRYYGCLDMLIVLADVLLMRFPLSAEAIHIRKAINETTDLPAPEPEPEQGGKITAIVTEFPEEMNIREAAFYLKSTVDTLYQMTSQRQIPHYKRGRRLIFIQSELKRWRLSKVFTNSELDTVAANHLFLDAALPGKRRGKAG